VATFRGVEMGFIVTWCSSAPPAQRAPRVERGREAPGLDEDEEEVVGRARHPVELAQRGLGVRDVLEHAGDVDDGRVVGDAGDGSLRQVGGLHDLGTGGSRGGRCTGRRSRRPARGGCGRRRRGRRRRRGTAELGGSAGCGLVGPSAGSKRRSAMPVSASERAPKGQTRDSTDASCDAPISFAGRVRRGRWLESSSAALRARFHMALAYFTSCSLVSRVEVEDLAQVQELSSARSRSAYR
jgi:hypothetical protein